MAKISVEPMLTVQVDVLIQDRFLDTIRTWANQEDGPVHVDIADYDDLAKYCGLKYRLSSILKDVRDRAMMEGVESILFY